MFRTAHEFETVVRLMKSTRKDQLLGLLEFVSATLVGDASVHGLANATRAYRKGSQPLYGRTYWGIHTFFADRDRPGNTKRSQGSVRIPYRYRLTVRVEPARTPSKGGVLAQYRDLVKAVEETDTSVSVDLSFMLPWQWERLTDWADVPEKIRLDLINPQAVWKDVCEIHMGTIVLNTVRDAKAANGEKTEKKWDDLLFDPTRLSKGLHLSEDPMLIALSSIYAESHMRRMG